MRKGKATKKKSKPIQINPKQNWWNQNLRGEKKVNQKHKYKQ